MSDRNDARQLVVFTLGEEEYALPISYVHEIIRYTEPRTVASADHSVRGVISLRGKILPVFDLATRLGITAGEPEERSKIVIVETGSEMAGVVVDSVEEVLTVEEQLIDDGSALGGISGAVIDGIAKIDDRLVVLLSPEAIVAIGADFSSAQAEVAAAATVRPEDVAVGADEAASDVAVAA
ncbi:chemotaxis protein CheW [Conexibacter sp. W3-3-2]|uniref:Chemotaxis protein CheW n=1 Tax=Paraconexibacter algicola TaxID=2133960 RepID=A0A2T4UIT7_9ACTN|nr:MULTISPECIES: chemotaxis protein CheW [Solirubrobacterales]MTD45477.1 chemotaxis protein CheW [Conexibacter sp. W3-3-2]PTL59164.1 chemotaxis protein CheW [Paraconexibacter algicola]